MVQRTALSSAEPDIRSAVTIRVAAQITLFGRGTGGHAADHAGAHNAAMCAALLRDGEHGG